MKQNHVIWDWNGTLLDDFAITATITSDALGDLGRPGVTHDDIRNHYQRPLSNYFNALLGRTALSHELKHLGDSYAARYEAQMCDLPLAAGAIDALEAIAPVASQSLLSMAPHSQIELLIEHHRLSGHFNLIHGFIGMGHPSKRESLIAHCDALGVAAERCWMIGDTVDDFDAASPLGIRTVLVTTGMQARADLTATGSPVVDTLAEAARLILDNR
ncbi:HAD hydrolase-like protein [Rhizobium rhizogenes]|jgi:phosphoglycolate phosphatase-like HAD superfamily hydrolase|uniref:HAD family hydrolase n=1 Tax=Rhizobium rhizogenes TaxID=359 RepID=UPI0022C925CF|nr:HAD hydrolase-like protein [Rhizobium rhizogenes]MCZ7463983.1 HAD hydrolase-like protein [Rhizobium rhizogenes]